MSSVEQAEILRLRQRVELLEYVVRIQREQAKCADEVILDLCERLDRVDHVAAAPKAAAA